MEGQVDAPFRIYRESERKASEYQWISVAGTIEEAQKVARDLRAEKAQVAHRLAARITNAVPMFEEREEKRRRREYRKQQKERFARPDPGFSLYEGRTRGKRMRYTYDDEDIYGSADDNRRSSRQSRTATPADGPTFTASGRQVRSAFGRSYGDRRVGEASSTRASSQNGEDDELVGDGRAPRRDGRSRRTANRALDGVRERSYPHDRYHVDEFDDGSSAESTGEEWAGDDQDFDDKDIDEGAAENDDADGDLSATSSDDELGMDTEKQSLIVKLHCGDRLRKFANRHGGLNTHAHNVQETPVAFAAPPGFGAGAIAPPDMQAPQEPHATHPLHHDAQAEPVIYNKGSSTEQSNATLADSPQMTDQAGSSTNGRIAYPIMQHANGISSEYHDHPAQSQALGSPQSSTTQSLPVYSTS